MKILVIGGTGTIGQAVVHELSQRHTIITAGREHGDVRLDMTNKSSIEAMYKSVGKFDALIVTAGQVHFAPLTDMTDELYEIGLKNKLMGQVNLVLIGMKYINDGGSFTLTSGILSQEPLRLASSAAMVNGAVDSFVKTAAVEMPRGIRINVVSPTILAESVQKYGDAFQGFLPVPAAHVALAYSKSVEGAQTGQIYRVGYTS
jgi:NAD(P)-dependent dehydrogenase (short-subunit alcohol dehydrogenase family)